MRLSVFIGLIATVLPVLAARAADISSAEDEAQKAEKLLLTPLPGGDYYDSVMVREMELAAKRRSPTAALWRSFAVPGWGQIYNDKYWKAPVFIVAEGVCLYYAITNYATARDYLGKSHSAGSEGDRIKYYDRYNDFVVETEFWGWMFVGFMAYSMMDAYVDAHLSDWEVEDLPQDEWAPVSSRKVEWDFAVGVADGGPVVNVSVSPF